jgi:hypothetical protein
MPHDCEPTGCLRPEGRGQRSSPRKTPFISSFSPEVVEVVTTTTTTTTTTIDPSLFDLISYPEDSDCPLITTTLPPMYFDATGGSIYVHGGGQSHVFTQDGEFCILPYYESEFQFATVEYLVIGGGGAGGNNVAGGGGGGGQFKTGSIKLESGCYQVSIGNGGQNGSDGQPSSFAGITSIGGGGGGSVFFNGRDGANGGGAGGRAIGGSSLISGGNRGGTSLNAKYGGGGGGAGSNGETVFNNSTKPGEGGSGKASSLKNGSLEYFAGGGAGGAKDGTQQTGGIGGGGGTLSKPGEDGTGGGGAALGDGGDGICILYYNYSTTTTTTTTLAPTIGPDAPSDLLATATDPYVVSLSWTPIENTGDCIDVYRYVLTYTYNDEDITTLQFDMRSTNLLQYDDANNKFLFSVSDLSSDLPYTFTVVGYNSCDLEGDAASVSIQHVTTTTTTTTTLPPENLLEFRFDFVDELEKGVISQSAIIFVGEQDSSNNRITIDFKVSDTAPDNYVFLSKPSIIPIAGDFNYIRSIDTELFDGGRFGQCHISFIMPSSFDAQVTVGFYGEAFEKTATTTTTTTVTTPRPFCRSLYDGMIIDGAAPTRDPLDYKMRPAQLFISRNYAFPHQITGTSFQNGTDSGRPWYDGILFEQSRGLSEIDDYIASLPENHNLVIPYTNFLGSVVDHRNILYKLFYPSIVIDEIFAQLSGTLDSESTNDHNLSYSLNIDFVCTVNEVDITGTGNGELEGFINIKFMDNGEIIHENTVQSIDERFTGAFTTQFNDNEYHYMIDFGTEDIKGKL